MTDNSPSPVGCLGRVLTFLGVVWTLIVVLVTIGVLTERRVGGDFLAGIGGSIVPALVLLAAGRALRRRANTAEGGNGPVTGLPQPNEPGRRVPTIRVTPAPPTTPNTTLTPPRLPSSGPVTSEPQAKPAPEPAPGPTPRASRGLEDVLPPPVEGRADIKDVLPSADLKPPPPKTSQEMVDEAKKRFGGNRPRSG